MDDLDNYDEDNIMMNMMETTFTGGGNYQNLLADNIDINYNEGNWYGKGK